MNLQKVRKTPAEDMEDWDIVLGRREAALSLSPWSWNRSEQGKCLRSKKLQKSDIVKEYGQPQFRSVPFLPLRVTWATL